MTTPPPDYGNASRQHGGYSPSQQPPPQPPGQAAITINSIQGFGGGTLYGVNDPDGPTILVNSHPVPAQWGTSVIPVPPGRHHVRVFVPYRFPKEYGPAEITVDVAPNQNVALEYRAPKWTFSRGALGPPPQRARGVGASLLALAVIFLVIAIIAVIVGALE
ncbi:hypothetical protein [Actinophytocola sp.]|uniref:hypothetical protein n=1 Tax=Actinophytocola sp. TaxID=1872138 RepID=UPI003D6BA79E